MSLPALVDVIIGLIFLFLTLSLMCTAANEVVAAVLKLRARYLAATMTQLIDDPNLRAQFYGHGMVTSASCGSSAGSSTDQHPSYFDARSVSLTLLSCLNPETPTPVISDIQSSVAKLPPSHIKDVLAANLAAAGQDIDAFRNGIADWYDGAMARLNGVYSRHMKGISFGIGLVLAVVFNADCLSVAEKLWQNEALRLQIVAAAADKIPQPNCPGNDPSAAIVCQAQGLTALSQTLAPLPIGWAGSGMPSVWSWAAVGWWLKTLAGWLLTALAVSLGAPFWFDVLQKFMALRASGTKPAARAGS